MITVSKLDRKFWQQAADRFGSDPADGADENPFALPPRFEEEETRLSVTARRRSLAQWISDAFERVVNFTMYTVAALAVIAFWIMLLAAAASIAVAVINGGAA